MTIGIIAVTTSVTVPVYRNYQIRSELMDATEQLLTAMRVAQLKARAGETAGTWGVQTAGATLFQGDSFAERDPAADEQYPLPPSVTVTGLEEIVFLPLSGLPVQSGEILLTASNGDSRTILVGEQGTVSATGLSVPSVFTGGGSDGSAGAGGGASSQAASSDASSDSSAGQASSAAGSVTSATSSSDGASSAPSSAGGAGSSAGDDGGQGGTSSDASSAAGGSSDASSAASSTSSTGLPTCEDRFFVGPDGSLQTTGRVSATFRALGSQITYGAGGPEVNVTLAVSADGGRQWAPLFGGNDVDGGETETVTGLSSGAKIVVKVTGKYSWMFSRTYVSNSGDGHIVALRDGARLPEYKAFDNQAQLETFLRDIIGGDGLVDIGAYDAVYLAEIGASLNSTAADFQDLVLLVQFTADAGSCASSSSSSTSSASSAASSVTSGASSAPGSAGSSVGSAGSSASSDSGKKITICHFADAQANTITISESAWPAHAAHGDRRGDCAQDDDDDDISNAEDFCPNTKVEQPKKYLLFFRNALTQDDSDIFRVGPTKKIGSFTLEDTGGCSCEQLLDVAEGKPGYYFLTTPSVYLSLRTLLDNYVSTARKYGCSSDLLNFIERGIRR